MPKTQKTSAIKTKKRQSERQSGSRASAKTAKKEQSKQPNTFFVMSMSFLAGALFFANLFMLIA